jgi:hypothetical protein
MVVVARRLPSGRRLLRWVMGVPQWAESTPLFTCVFTPCEEEWL